MTLVACAAVLTSAVALTGCKGNQNEPEQKKEAVKTEFAISLPAQASSNGVRRMPGTTVPESGTFLGMKNIKLIPFAKVGAIASGDPRLGNANIDLTAIPKTGEGTLTTTGNAKVYSSISIPLTTSAFLVYAEATNAAAASDADAAKHTNGVVVPTGINAGAPAGITFDLDKVLGTADLASIYSDATAANLLTLLNNVANAQDENSKAWKAYTTGTDDAGMADIFATYSTMHALSSFEVLRVLSDIYKSVDPLTTGAAEPVKTLATKIQAAIETGITVDRGTTPFTFTLKDGYTGYPANLNLPDGSVRIKYDAGDFKACVATDYDSKQTDPTKFVYPASLWYYANSNIKTANSSQKALLESNNTWANIITAYPTASTAVNTLTRSVAITNAIQYAVARLDVTVKLATSTLKDKIDQDITANSTDGFIVSAVFVGGQRQVNFDFTPNTAATAYTIYDNVMKNTMNAKATTASAVNSTLVFETPATTKDADQEDANADIMIAIELTNNTGKDFIGANNQLIPKDGKFYLVGKMIASKASETGKKVFKQDYTTTANLTIQNLKNAYNEIPDLRTPQLELGMSVDLTWETGHAYEINL